MFAEQRQEKIMHLLSEYKQVDVSSLTSILSVSEATIRRDLEKLEQVGLLRRTHGGAILVEEKNTVIQAITKAADLVDNEIDNIGKTAARMIESGDVIAIGTGPLGLSLARSLHDSLQCTIVTNDAMIMTELLHNDQANVIMVGGLAKKTDQAVFTTGEATIRMLEEFSVQKAFLSVDGISITAGLTSRDFEYAIIWKKLMAIAQETIIMAPMEAFNRRELVRLVPMDKVDRYVTSGKIKDDFKKYFHEHNIPVYIDFDL